MFIVCGEALFDVFATEATPTGLHLDGRIGGSPFNVAMGLARLGQAVHFLGGIGAGVTGDRLMQALVDERIGTRCVARIDAPVTLSLVGLDAQGVPAYALYGAGCADRLLRPEHLAAVPADAAALHFGSYAMVVAPTATTLRALVERQQGRSLIAYDPNIRTNVEPDLARWRETVAWMLPRTQVLKVSDEDLNLLYPQQSIDAFGARAVAAGVGLVVVTRGSAGAVAWAGGQRIEVPGQAVEVADTVGAGDTFQAALLTWLAEHDRLRPGGVRSWTAPALTAAIAFAVRAAAVTCTRRGADLPRRDELR